MKLKGIDINNFSKTIVERASHIQEGRFALKLHIILNGRHSRHCVRQESQLFGLFNSDFVPDFDKIAGKFQLNQRPCILNC